MHSDTRLDLIAHVTERASAAAFGKPLITNVHRGLVVETIVATALEPEWQWCSADYASWDFENAAGLRLEVKQSAAWQSWSTPDAKASACSFDIAARTGRWEGAIWFEEAGRHAHLYVFAHHPGVGSAVDHRDPLQWVFYVVATKHLPAARRISLAPVRRLAEACSYSDLRASVERVAADFAVG